MEKFVIRGGSELHGEIEISGAKNAAVAILPATILAKDIFTIENVPDIKDINSMLQILEEMGAAVRYLDRSTIQIDTRNIFSPDQKDSNAEYCNDPWGKGRDTRTWRAGLCRDVGSGVCGCWHNGDSGAERHAHACGVKRL